MARLVASRSATIWVSLLTARTVPKFTHVVGLLSDTKTGKQTMVLNSAALEILADIERVEGSPFVIPGADRSAAR